MMTDRIVRTLRQAFWPLARAVDEIEFATGGLGTALSLQNKRDVFRSVVQAVLESILISATQKERVVPVLMKQFAIPQEDANLILDIVHKGWALDGQPNPAAKSLSPTSPSVKWG